MLLAFFFASTSWAEIPPLKIAWKDNHLSIRAEKTPLVQVLKEIAHHTGVEMHGLEKLQEPVSAYFVDLPLQEALEKLGVNGLIIWRDGRSGIQPVTAFLSPRSGKPQAGTLPVDADFSDTVASTEGERQRHKRLTILYDAAKHGDEATLRQAVGDPDLNIRLMAVDFLAQKDPQKAQAALLDATKSDQPEVRLNALQLLGQTDTTGGSTLAALAAAVHDENRDVKSYAIQALADRGGSEALGYLLQAARDPDAEVRKLVVQSLSLREEGYELLENALSDKDEGVRSMAKEALDVLNGEEASPLLEEERLQQQQ
jgi:hypothetical protein